MSAYDDWKAHEPESCNPGRAGHPTPPRFRCTVCEWTGKGYGARHEHFHKTGHRSEHADYPMFQQRTTRRTA